MRGLTIAAEALNADDVGLAMIAALHLRLPDLNEEERLRILRADELLAKYSQDQPRDWHGRWTAEDAIQTAPNHEKTVEREPHRSPAPPRRSDDADSENLGESERDERSRGGVPRLFAAVDQCASSPSAAPDTDYLLTDVQYRGVFHDQLVKQYAAYLREKGEIVETEVKLTMADGSAGARLDVLARDRLTGIIYGVEVKTGLNPFFTPGQIIVYPHLMMGESVIATDPKIVSLELIPGMLLPPILIFSMQQRDSTSSPVYRPLNPQAMARNYKRR